MLNGARLLAQARALQRQFRFAEAIDLFSQALALSDGDAEARYEFGYLLKAGGRYEEAAAAFGAALARGISRPEEVHLSRGVIYSDHLRDDASAQRELLAALALVPDYVPALLNLGNLHEERGERDEALGMYDQLLENPGRPGQPHEHLRLEALARSAQLRPPVDLADPLLGRLRQAADAQSDKTVRANLLFSLGHAYDRLKAYDLAFEAFAKANRWLMRQTGRRYNSVEATKATDALIASFDTAENDVLPVDSNAVQPLFICGMFRSGSTLVEQVLAAHPQVIAGGELNYLRRIAMVDLAPFPESMAVRDTPRDATIAHGYMAHLAMVFPDAAKRAYVTDKRPDNFELIGLIKRLFPAAKIVHTARNAVDNGLSIFTHHLQTSVAGYSTDLSDIGHAFGQYGRLMSHWKTLYPTSILDFDYDDFVRDPKPALERLMAFLGLPWDDRCLHFHRLGNTVKTASYWQIREPLHRNASGRWRSYANHLQPLRRALVESDVTIDDEV